jgi:hypothetical protein
MNAPLPFTLSPRCHATSKRSGLRCKAPAVRGHRVCRFHGARGGGPLGARNGAYRHGLYTGESLRFHAYTKVLMRQAKIAIKGIADGGED